MVANPAALILVNKDLTDNVESMLTRQLFIDKVLDGATFDNLIASDLNYVAKIKQLNQRIMVVRPFNETQNRDLFDVVIFIKAGLASVEKNKFGPPCFTRPVVNIYWGALGVF